LSVAGRDIANFGTYGEGTFCTSFAVFSFVCFSFELAGAGTLAFSGAAGVTAGAGLSEYEGGLVLEESEKRGI